MKSLALIAFASTLLLVACGDSKTTVDAPVVHDSPTVQDSPVGGTNLTVKNYLAWCKVTVGTNAPFTNGSMSFTVPAGASTNVSAVALPSFELGTKIWHHTVGDTDGTGEHGAVTGTGQTASSATTVAVPATGSKCIWVCCQTVGMNDCPTTDQCL